MSVPTHDRDGHRPVRLVDVAHAARVSAATVSRTLNDHHSVDPELARRVRDAALSLGYRPNAVARNLRRRGTQVWALIIPDVTNPFYTAVARGVGDVAQAAGYSVLLGNTDEDADSERGYLDVAIAERVAGVILTPRSTSTDITALRASTIPLVVADREVAEPVDFVTGGSYDGAVAATEHLVEQGWSRPACLTRPADAATTEHRVRGYTEVVRRHGLPELVRVVPFHDDGGAAVADLFDGPTPPDALLTVDSMLALGAWSALQQRKRRIGVDVGVISFDDAAWSQVVTPPLSVVTQPAYEIGRASAELLVSRIRADGPADTHQVQLPTTLIIRDSSRRPQRR